MSLRRQTFARPPAGPLSENLANKSLCDVLAGFAVKSTGLWELPIVTIFGNRYAMRIQPHGSFLHAEKPAGLVSRWALVLMDGVLADQAGTIVGTVEDLAFVLPKGPRR